MILIVRCFPRLVLLSFLLVIFSINDSYAQDNVLKFDHITTNHGLPNNTVYGISRDKYGFVWFSTFSGLARYDGYKMIIYRTKGNDSKSIINNRVKCILKDSKGDLWISFFDTNVLCRYNYEQDNFTRFNLSDSPKNIVDSLYKIYTAPLLVVGNKDYGWSIKRWQDDERNHQLFQENKHSGEKHTYYHNPSNHYSLDEFNNAIYLDEQGILWIGTYLGGISKTDTYSKKFQHFYHIEGDSNTLVDNVVRGICDDKDGNVWIGTFSKGITCFNRKNHTFFHLKKTSNSSNSLITNSIRKLYLDHAGVLWIGTKDGLGRYDPKLKQFKQYTFERKQIPNNWIFSILEDSSRNLWVGTYKGLARYNARLDKFIGYDSTIVPKSLRIRSMILDSKNNIWAGTEGNGVFKFHISKDGALTSKSIAYSKTNFNLNRIYCLLEDNQGNFWFGTAGGLQKYDTEKHLIKDYNLKGSLLGDKTIVGLLNGSKGEIWVSHAEGLTKINPLNDSEVNYNLMDGVISNELLLDASYKSPYTNELFFGGINGLDIFYPDSIVNNPFLPNIVFTELKIKNKTVKLGDTVNGRVILTKPLYLTSEIFIKHADIIFSVEFAAIHFSDPKANKYRYRLKGFDKDWIYTDATNRTVTYSNLWPGLYVLEVCASNNDGIWTKEPVQLRIIVLRAWWQQWWFIAIAIMSFFTFIYLAYLVRVSFYRKQHEQLNTLVKNRTSELEEKNQLLIDRQLHIERQTKELQLNSENLIQANLQLLEKQTLIQEQAKKLQDTNDELSSLNLTKDRFFSILAHDLRNPFNTVSGFSELLLRNLERYTPDKIRHFIEVINKTSHNTYLLLNNLLDWSRSQSGQMQFNPININLHIIVEETLVLLTSQATQKSIEISHEVEPDIFVLADENMLKTVLRNLISNAIKFTNPGGMVTIKASQKDEMVIIEVIDTGIGISPEKIDVLFRIDVNFHNQGTNNEHGTGLGLILCKEFIEKNGGKIWVESVMDKGSTFVFTLKSI